MLEAIIGSDNIGLTLLMLLQQLIIVVIALTVHEVAHGWVAKLLGDHTAESLGRLSLNPLKHLDLWGFLCMMLAGFGWAKPVPIRTRNFKHPRRDMALSALAGPVSNLLLAGFGWVIFECVARFAPEELLMASFGYIEITAESAFAVNMLDVGMSFLYTFCYLNISLAVFNFLPIPPLDGSRIFYVFLPDKLYFGVMKHERTISMVIAILLITGVLDTPLMWAVEKIMTGFDFIIPII